MSEIKHREVKKFLSDDDLEMYPASTLKTRDVELNESKIFFLDVGVNPHISFRYQDSVVRDSDKELLDLYLD